MALSANNPLTILVGELQAYPLYQAIHAYEGGMIFYRADGYATNVAGGLPFLGHSYAEADNTTGASGALEVYIRNRPYFAKIALSGLAITDVGKDVYASDDATLTLVATGNSRVGKVATWISSGVGIVEFQPLVGADVADHGHTAGTDGGKLTSPLIVTGIKDTNGNEIIDLGATTEAVNELKVSNAATGAGPILEATGETNVPITLKGKGTGKAILGQATSTGVQLAADQPVLDSSGNELLKFVKAADAVNELTINNAATGAGPILEATGETNVPATLRGKGTGAVILGQATSTDVRLSADQPLGDSSGNELIKFVKAADALNEITVANAATGNAPSIKATGETNVGLTVAPKGIGVLTLCDVATQKLALFGATGAVQQNHIADGKTDYTTGDLDIEAEIIAAINTTNGKINSILAALEAYGALKTT